MQVRPTEAIFRPAIILMTGQIVGFIAAFALPLVLARLFNQEEFGTYKLLFVIYETVLAIAQFGMIESLYYFLPNEKRHGGSYVVNTLLAMTIVGAACFIGLWWLQVDIADSLNNEHLIGYIPLIGIFLFFMLLAKMLELTMIVRKKHGLASVVYAFTDIVRMAMFLLPLLFISNLTALLWGAIGFAMLRFIATLMFVGKEYKLELKPDGAILKKHLAYAVPFGIAGLVNTLQYNYHYFIVSSTFDAATFAIYAVGCLQNPLLGFLMSSTSNVMMVNMQEKADEGDKEGVLAIYTDAVRKLSLVFFPLIGLLVAVAYELITVFYTDSYADSVPVFIVWSLASLTMVFLLQGVLRVYAENRFLIYLSIFNLFVTVIAINWFLDYFGLIGAVLVTLFATIVYDTIAIMKIKRMLNTSYSEVLPWGAMLNLSVLTSIAGTVTYFLKPLTGLEGFPLLFIASTIFCLISAPLIFFLGPIHKEERIDLLRQAQVNLAKIGIRLRLTEG